MPGSIQVSVLDFKELPISSNSVKVSLGKVEHEAGEKGTYSFPLTNLRDNLIISIEDSEGNQLSNSGVRTMTIIEKGTWDDVFLIEGGGHIHMKLEFILSDEERKRIRLMREKAMKKKQAETLASRPKNEESAKFLTSSLSRHEVSDVLRATSSQDLQRSDFNSDDATPLNDNSVKALESSDGINGEYFQNKREETSFSHTTETIDQNETVVDTESRDSPTALPNSSGNLVEKLNEQNLEEKILSDVKTTSEETTSTPLSQETNNKIPLQQVEVPKNLLKDNETRELVKKDNADKSEVSDNLVVKLEKQNLEENNPSYVKKMSKESKFPLFSQETEVNTVKNIEIQLQEADVPKKLQDSTKSIIAEKIKSFSPKIAGETDKQGSLEKTPRSIKKMISVFESSISQDEVPLKPLSAKSLRVGTSRLLKDNPLKDYSESSQEWLNNSETSTSTRLKNSFSTGDLRKDLSNIITKGDQVGFETNFFEPRETNMQSYENNPEETDIFQKDLITVASIGVNNEENIALTETNIKDQPNSPQGVSNDEKIAVTETNTKDLPNSPQESVHNEKKFALTESDAKTLLESCDEDATISGRMSLDDIKKDNEKESVDGRSTLKDDLEYFDHDGSGQLIFVDEFFFCRTVQGDSAMSLFGDCKMDEKSHQENIVASMPEIIVKGESEAIEKQDEEVVRVSGNSSPKSADEEASNGSVGQVIKIALAVGFGVLVLLFRQRDSGKSKKKQNNVALKNQVFMNKRGSIEKQRRKIGVIKLS